ncbi:MAG: VWA domain-containing protein [Verrucomicrobia bacterium]|nr:VWA domain-containing protein [Verrucomicrobiota bacterium]
MSFAHPWQLLLLAAPVLLGWWEGQRRGHPLVLPFDHAQARHGRFLRRLVTGANLLAPLLLAVAILLLAGPQRLAQPESERVLTNIHFVMDVSGSMMSPFGDGKRADKALKAIEEFTTYRKGDAFGLTVFGSDVLHWVPVTKDLSAIRLSAPFIRPEKMPPWMGGTLIGRALRSVRNILAARAEGDRMVVLISDGESADLGGGVAQELGEELAKENIVVFYIHAAEGSPQEETFTLASLTGGAAFAAGDPAALSEVFKRIDAMKPAKMKPSAPEPVDFFWPVVVPGLALLGLQVVGAFGVRYTPW